MKLFFVIFISFSTGWIFHFLLNKYTIKAPFPITYNSSSKNCSNQEANIANYKTIEKIVIKEVIKIVPQEKIVYKIKEASSINSDKNKSIQDLFLLYLKKEEFYNAIAYYQETEEEKHSFYQTLLFAYFSKIQKKDPIKAMEEMQYFIEVEPESKTIVFQLAQLFEDQQYYQEALTLIIDFSYIVSYNEKNSIHTKLKSISINYIKKLKSSNNFEDLIQFLINQINVGILNDFYSFELAKVYFNLKKYINSIEILEEVQYNNIYKERAVEMLSVIQNKLEEKEEYPIQIPLIKDGVHFFVKAYAQDVAVLLMIDTGASLTSVDKNKISHFKVLQNRAKFNTAGGETYKTIFQADTFRIGLISLKNFRLSGTQFSGKNSDGLLGMNFLGRFKFKINQKEKILFLGEKNN